ncbi:MAG TPA: sigma-54 dependent transcriptional regulator [Anaeromyxobacter sp.]
MGIGKRILVVDDHPEMARLLADQLTEARYVVERAHGGAEALRLARAELPSLVVTDLRMKEVDGFDVLEGVHELDPDVPVIVMTAFGAIETAIEAIKRGAYHYVTKPFLLAEILAYIERALAERRIRAENAVLRRGTKDAAAPALVGASAPMRALHELIAQAGPSAAPVLITGESGTGKELVARAIHEASERRAEPFVAVNCTALPESLLESELFGHTRGAFSGATAPRRGLFVEADGGTLLLDEIGDMPAALQAKLLRILQDGEVRAVGSDTIRRVDVRIIAATNHDVDAQVASGKFRGDLFFRLNVVRIEVPPLRTRRDDVPALLDHFLARARARNRSASAKRFDPDVAERLAAHSWPGNVRELENVVERLVVLSRAEEIGSEELDRFAPQLVAGPSPLDAVRDRMVSLREMEDAYIAWVLARCDGNKTRAAEVLGLDVSTIHRRVRDRATP